MIETFEQVLEWTKRMPRPLRIGVLTSCTNQKRPLPVKAEELYLGKQHTKLMRGVQAVRDRALARDTEASVDVWIASAKHGIIPGTKVIEPYDVSFRPVNYQGVLKLRERGEQLGMPEALRAFLGAPYDLKLVLLGNDYLDACHVEIRAVAEGVERCGETVFFCAPERAARLVKQQLKNTHIVELGPAEATRYGDGLISLKGRLAATLLGALAWEKGPQPEAALCETP